jgi:hypothetical protein
MTPTLVHVHQQRKGHGAVSAASVAESLRVRDENSDLLPSHTSRQAQIGLKRRQPGAIAADDERDQGRVVHAKSNTFDGVRRADRQ